MGIRELNEVGVVWRVIGAFCTAYLVWSFLAQDRMLLRARRRFYTRFPPDKFLYLDGAAVPKKYTKMEKWGGSIDSRETPIGLRSFVRVESVLYEVTSGSMVAYDGLLPSPCLLQHEGVWRLVGGDVFVEGWVKHTPRGRLLLTEGEELPRWRVEMTEEGWRVPGDGGSWLGEWLSCSNCSALWFAILSTVIVVLAGSVVVLLGLCAISGVAVRILAKVLR